MDHAEIVTKLELTSRRLELLPGAGLPASAIHANVGDLKAASRIFHSEE
jgi:hypothetical protein